MDGVTLGWPVCLVRQKADCQAQGHGLPGQLCSRAWALPLTQAVSPASISHLPIEPMLPRADHAGLCAVRQIDRREPLGGPRCLVDVMSRQDSSASARPLGARRRLRVSLNSIDAPASKPHLFAVGGSDPWLRVYDRRMAGLDHSLPRVSALAPCP